jgi:hypothetical protein
LLHKFIAKKVRDAQKNAHRSKEQSKKLLLHACVWISTLSTTSTHRRKMATHEENALCVLEIHSAKPARVQREVASKFKKDSTTPSSITSLWAKMLELK